MPGVRVVPDTGQSSTSAIDVQDALELTVNDRAAFPVVYFLRRQKSQRPINPTRANATGAVRWRLISTTSFRFCSRTEARQIAGVARRKEVNRGQRPARS